MTRIFKATRGLAGALVASMLLAPIAGCVSLAPEVTHANNHVQMPNYAFVVPPDRGWHLQRFAGPAEATALTQRVGPFSFEIKLMRAVVADEALKQATAKAVADDFRELERQIMVEQGVNQGLYRLENVVLGEEAVGDLTFYTMKYVTLGNWGTQRAALYLWFPEPERNEAFIVAHYAETAPPNGALFESSQYLADFKSTLQSLVVR